MASPPTYRLTIRPIDRPGLPPAINRLRSALKSLLRCYGLRVVECREVITVITSEADKEPNQ